MARDRPPAIGRGGDTRGDASPPSLSGAPLEQGAQKARALAAHTGIFISSPRRPFLPYVAHPFSPYLRIHFFFWSRAEKWPEPTSQLKRVPKVQEPTPPTPPHPQPPPPRPPKHASIDPPLASTPPRATPKQPPLPPPLNPLTHPPPPQKARGPGAPLVSAGGSRSVCLHSRWGAARRKMQTPPARGGQTSLKGVPYSKGGQSSKGGLISLEGGQKRRSPQIVSPRRGFSQMISHPNGHTTPHPRPIPPSSRGRGIKTRSRFVSDAPVTSAASNQR